MPLRVTKGTRIAAGLFTGIDFPMTVIGKLEETEDVVVRVAGTHTCYVITDVEWIDPQPRIPNSRYWNDDDEAAWLNR